MWFVLDITPRRMILMIKIKITIVTETETIIKTETETETEIYRMIIHEMNQIDSEIET